jgi:hypothetical protein
MQTHLNAAGSTLIKTGGCRIESLSINTGAATSNIALYDGTSAAGTLVALVDTTTPRFLQSVWTFRTGLFTVVTGAPDLTMVWR